MNNGSLVYDDYLNLIEKKMILTNNLNFSQVQPSSMDLTLSDECYQIDASFLSPNIRIRDKLKNIKKNKINLNKEQIFKKK